MTRRDDFSQAILYAAPPPLTAGEDEFDALGILRLVRRRIGVIAVVGVLVVALALPLILAMAPKYTAASRILIQSPLTTALATTSGDRPVDLKVTTEVERLLSRDAALEVIRALHIDALPEFNPALRPPSRIDVARTWLRGQALALFGMPAAEPKGPPLPRDPVEQALPDFRGALTAALEPYSSVVRIEFSSRDPQLAAAVPNTLLTVYLSEGERALARNVQRADDWLGQRIAEQQGRVDAAAAAVAAFEQTSGLTSDQRAEATQTIATLTTLRTDVASQRARIGMTLSDLEAASSTAEKVTLIDSAPLSELSRDLRARRFDLDRLLRTHGDTHPEVAAARAAVADLTTQLDLEVGRQMSLMQSRLSMLGPQDDALGQQLGAASARLAHIDALGVRRDELKRVVDAEQATLERLEEKGRSLQAEGKLPVADVEVLSPAAVPLAPVGRGKTFFLAAACVAAALAGLTAACLIELFDRSVRSFQQVRDVQGLVPSAMVPRAPGRVTRSIASLMALGHEGMFGEAMRAILLSLRQPGSRAMPTSLLVTSPLPGAGKSLIAAALAVEVAGTGTRVLLVDGDLTHGRLHRFFGLPDSPGFSDYLAGTAPLEAVIRRDVASGIDFIPLGTRQPGRLRDDERIPELLEAAKASHRLLILDSAPVFASTRTVKIAGLCQRTLLVIRWGRTSRNAVDSAVLALRDNFGEAVIGVINLVNPRRHVQYGFKDADTFSRSLRRYAMPRSSGTWRFWRWTR